MPRVYKTKQGSKKREHVNKETLKSAVYEVIFQQKSLRGVAKSYNMSVMTLKRYVRKKREAMSVDAGTSSPTYEPNYRKAQIFTESEELDLSKYLEIASKLYHGLTPKATRQLAFQFAKENNEKIPTKWQKDEIASYDWFHGFMRRQTNLSLRVPEATSLSRATSFNKHNVSKFFENLRSLYTRYNFEAKDIWNLDETGLTTVHKPKRIIACKGMKQVSKVTSAERGELVTLCCAINAAGGSTPPFLIFPRKNWQDRMKDNGPPGIDGAPHPSGWMTATNFVLFLKHFIKHVRCSKEYPCLIIMDNHESHISIDSVNFARDNGIHLLTIPPHTSQKLQPLDRILFGTLKSYYNTACDDWMLENPGRPLTIYDIAGRLGKAYPLAMTPKNITKSFQITGIYPFESNIFTEDEFLSSYVTDRPEESVLVQEGNETINNETNIANATDDDVTDAEEYLQNNDDTVRLSSPLILEQCNIPLEQTQPDENICSPACVTLSQRSLSAVQKMLVASYDESFKCAENVMSQTTSTKGYLKSTNTLKTAPNLFLNRSDLQQTVQQTSTNVNSGNKSMVSTIKSLSDFEPPSTSNYKSPSIIKPYPKAGPRKGRKGKKKGSTRIITDTPEKNQIEEDARRKDEKKKKTTAKSVKRNFTTMKQNTKKTTRVKRQKRNSQISASSEEETTLPPSPESDYAIDEMEECMEDESEEEEYDEEVEDDIQEGDWVVVNFVSQRSIPHRYVGQVVNVSLASLDIKFAKKITDKRFKWPEKPDISVIGKYQVVKKIPAPFFKSTSKRIGTFEFQKSLRQFKIEK